MLGVHMYICTHTGAHQSRHDFNPAFQGLDICPHKSLNPSSLLGMQGHRRCPRTALKHHQKANDTSEDDDTQRWGDASPPGWSLDASGVKSFSPELLSQSFCHR